jgi:ethanolamine utilization protein EutQ (cupin superfamily)
MNDRMVQNLQFNPEHTTDYGSQHTEDRYKTSPLKELGPAFYVFDEDSETAQLTLGYEELLYIVEGQMTLTVMEGDQTYSVQGGPGDVLAISKGSTLSYAAIKGTRAFVTFTPLNWEDLLESASE